MTTKTIGSGGDYSTIAAWFAACPANLVSTTQTWIGQLLNQVHDLSATAVTFSGITTSATYYVELTTASGASFRDNASVQTNALRYNASNGAAITFAYYSAPLVVSDAMYVRFTGLQVQNTYGAGNSRALSQTGASGNVTINHCILEAGGSSGAPGIVELYGSGSTVSNSVAVSRRSSDAAPAFNLGNGASAYNCTGVSTLSGGNALAGNYGTPIVKNCSLFGFAAIKTGGNTPTYTTCATNIASPPSGFTGSLTASAQFQSVTDGSHDLRIKSGAALIDVGTTETTYAAVDIAGTSRPSGSSYDIGCWEFVGGTTHAATGALTSGAATIAGAAIRNAAHAATGALVAAAATFAGTANHLTSHAATGTLTAGAATVAGTAARTGAVVSFTTEAFMNNTETPLASTAVDWEWHAGGVIGSAVGTVTNGSGTTNGSGVLVATGMTAGAGYLLATDGVGHVYYEEGTAA